MYYRTPIDNEYYRIYCRYHDPNADRKDRLLFNPNFVESFYARTKYSKMYSWAVPNDEALLALAKYSPILEIGAGTGYWASLLRGKMGVDIDAYDIAPPDCKSNKYCLDSTFTEVKQGGPSVCKKHPDRTLFLCWPPYTTNMAFNCLRNYKGQTVIYIGEGDGGCTGNNKFHDMLEKRFEEVEVICIPQWSGINDRMMIYRRKNDNGGTHSTFG